MWSKKRALAALNIQQLPFDSGHPQLHKDGVTHGYSDSLKRTFAVNPESPYKQAVVFHELGHIVLEHASTDGRSLCLNELEASMVSMLCQFKLKREKGRLFQLEYFLEYLGVWKRHETGLPVDFHTRVNHTVETIVQAGSPEKLPLTGNSVHATIIGTSSKP